MKQLTDEGVVLVSLIKNGIVYGCIVENDPEASCECVECHWNECQMRGKAA